MVANTIKVSHFVDLCLGVTTVDAKTWSDSPFDEDCPICDRKHAENGLLLYFLN